MIARKQFLAQHKIPVHREREICELCCRSRLEEVYHSFMDPKRGDVHSFVYLISHGAVDNHKKRGSLLQSEAVTPALLFESSSSAASHECRDTRCSSSAVFSGSARV
ncbi:hypothetical protein EVAR_60412_1 [Eumeta japonica]|uniref:Uncharacterized protein n=1 Tax=Eumeta variegata TaxID=151549 RepID=A0A4C1ZIL3_EUMVA|nr:hypothetical protein EVAR_60412_1 [Eumeta japonica]